MVRIILGGILGGIVLFAWGAVYWVLGMWLLYPPVQFPDEPAIQQVLAENVTEHRLYWLPSPPMMIEGETPEEHQARMDEFNDRHVAGPIGYMVIKPEGVAPMRPIVFIRGFGLSILSALVASCLLMAASTGRSFIGRWFFVLGLGIFISVAVRLISWNYMYDPMQYTMFMVIDALVGWGLAGVVLAAIVRKKPPAAVQE